MTESRGIVIISLAVVIIVAFIVLFPILYNDSNRTKISNWWSDEAADIKCYSGGVLVIESTSTGKIQDAANSDGYFWVDKETGKGLESNGDCVLRYLD